MIRIGSFELQFGSMSMKRYFPMHSNGNQPGRSRTLHVTLLSFGIVISVNNLQAWKRHVEMGYVGMVTGLPNIKSPGDVHIDEWDSWHSLIVNDELSRVVGGFPGID